MNKLTRNYQQIVKKQTLCQRRMYVLYIPANLSLFGYNRRFLGQSGHSCDSCRSEEFFWGGGGGTVTATVQLKLQCACAKNHLLSACHLRLQQSRSWRDTHAFTINLTLSRTRKKCHAKIKIPPVNNRDQHPPPPPVNNRDGPPRPRVSLQPKSQSWQPCACHLRAVSAILYTSRNPTVKTLRIAYLTFKSKKLLLGGGPLHCHLFFSDQFAGLIVL